MIKLIYVVFLVAIVGCNQGVEQQVVLNSSFEDIRDGQPHYWAYGFAEEPIDPSLGAIMIDNATASTGARSLRIDPSSDSGPFVSQILHVPTYDLAGKKVSLRANIRTENLSGDAFVILAAYNPEMPKDPVFNIHSSGRAFIMASKQKDAFAAYADHFIARAKAEYLILIIGASGKEGSAWFDSIQVTLDAAEPGPGPDNATVKAADVSSAGFSVGITSENPIDSSDAGLEDLVAKAAEQGDMINFFFHVHYNALTGKDLLSGHELRLRAGEWARDEGLKRAVTLDFTHGSAETVGNLNPLPDGTPVESLSSEVQQAYINELMALCQQVEPAIVIVGLEVDIFHDNHPDQWQSFIAMYKSAYARVKQSFPDAHVTAYFTLPWMVNEYGEVNEEHKKVWQMLLPELDSVAYSTYPSFNMWHFEDIPDGYFTAASAVAPDRPLAICEFGMRSDSPFSETEQADVLRRILEDVGREEPAFLVWYSLYDQQYLGAPFIFKNAFSCIGLRHMDGTPKESWEVMRKLKKTSVQ